jgi:spore maturation protein CgeB
LGVRSRLRHTPVYSLWQIYRESQQLQRFNLLLDRSFGNCRSLGAYSEPHIRAKLAQKQSKRQPLLGDRGKPCIVAFGTRDWEQYGLWPTFERTSDFTLFDYQRGNKLRHHLKPTDTDRRQLAAAFLETVDRSDLRSKPSVAFFYAAGTYISNEFLDELHRRGIWTVVMSLDDKQQFHYTPDGISDQMRVAARCDLYWTVWKTGVQIVRGLDGTPWYAPEAADPAFHHRVDVPRDLEIVFIGQSYGLRTNLVRYLQRRGFQIEIFGSGWPNGFVSFEKTRELYSRAHIVLGLGGVGHMSSVKHLKGRDFEVPMCGGLYLTTFNPELSDHYQIGKEILCYSSFEECAEIVHWILRHPEEAQEIRQTALDRSLREHTWDRRFRQLFELFPQ